MYDDELLIELVQAKPSLIDMGTAKYKRNDIKNNNYYEVRKLLAIESLCFNG